MFNAKTKRSCTEKHRHVVSLVQFSLADTRRTLRMNVPCLTCGKMVQMRKAPRITAAIIGWIGYFLFFVILFVCALFDTDAQTTRYLLIGGGILSVLGLAARFIILKWGEWEEVEEDDVSHEDS